MTPEDVANLRRKLNVSPATFAMLLNVSTVTAVSWEKGRCKPSGVALRLLQLVQKQPDLLETL